ncbi:hypothetical protein COCC4DRAFT_65024 [Bipolaris maydis ATCC 48331]|uniref:Uncharacterized protein n=1 Tax=Cochliobolus heterostrophus (strain C4 / ATCC 48331 / race T) TaxID=665024 RepID=N4WXD8_COCH4|nr:uncharacterized protein COCC4DRAFT_65024 [Bipolaris maydis ATCC 48331]ENI00893.1 hypothetical protein COCC4DRAFT_65024 [Bipolaris maydis ATCC 48331]
MARASKCFRRRITLPVCDSFQGAVGRLWGALRVWLAGWPAGLSCLLCFGSRSRKNERKTRESGQRMFRALPDLDSVETWDEGGLYFNNSKRVMAQLVQTLCRSGSIPRSW